MNRIDAKFKELRDRNEPAFIPFITAGDPSLKATRELIVEFDRKRIRYNRIRRTVF